MDGGEYGGRSAWGGCREGPERSPAQAGVWCVKRQGALSERDPEEPGLEGRVRLCLVIKEGKGVLGRDRNMSSGTEA